MSRYIDADALINDLQERYCRPCKAAGLDYNEVRCRACQFDDEINDIDGFADNHIEPNLILPERMERGDIYEVGETIVVMNHDDYYDLLCKSWVPKRGEWKNYKDEHYCTNCGEVVIGDWYDEDDWYNYCPNCGADMRGKDDD